MKKRNLDITEQTINCVGDLEVDLDKGFIEAAYELWFDVDRYFGTDTRDKDDTWINFYTRWHPDRTITAIYFTVLVFLAVDMTWQRFLKKNSRKITLERVKQRFLWNCFLQQIFWIPYPKWMELDR